MSLKSEKKIINGWAFYDWANSVYPLVITTAIFPTFYSAITPDKVTFFGLSFINTELYAYIGATSFLIVSILSPILTGIADYMGNKKIFLKLFCYIGAASCCSLYYFDENQLELSMIPVVLAGVGFWGSIVFYNSYLPDIAPKSEHDKISAKGFSLGYLGSGILLIIDLILIMNWETFGFKSQGYASRFAFLTAGIWWVLFSQYTYMVLPKGNKKITTQNIFTKGFEELVKVFKEFKTQEHLKKYLRAYFIYSMGVQTIMYMATLFAAKEIDWGTDDKAKSGLIISVLIIQFIAIGGSYFCSWLSKKLGNIKALTFIVASWILACIIAFYITQPIEFYCLATLVGFIMGGTQSLSRSTYSKLLPVTDDTASYFSYYDVLEKLGIVVGTISFGFINALTGSMRSTVFVLATYFIVGAFLLLLVPKEVEKV